jgi:hypothetical protein
MSYLKTVLTYHQPSEAEIDKAFLESEDIAVCLLNANTSRNELGAPFYIQLQVAEEDHARAVALLKEANPQRFGSAERVAALEKELIRVVLWFVVPALVVAVGGFLWLSESDLFRTQKAVSWGILAGFAALGVRKFWSRKKI